MRLLKLAPDSFTVAATPPISSRRRSMTPAPCGASAIAAPATRSETNTKPSSGSSSITSHLDLDDLADPEVADRLHDDGAAHHHLTHALLEQEAHVFRVDEHQRAREHGGQRQQHVAGEAPVRGMDPHLTQNLEALADDVGEVVEDLGQVAARVPLNQDGRHEEPHVEQPDPVRELVERILERQTEVLLIE